MLEQPPHAFGVAVVFNQQLGKRGAGPQAITTGSAAVVVDRVLMAFTLPESRSTWFLNLDHAGCSPAIQYMPIIPPHLECNSNVIAGGGCGLPCSALVRCQWQFNFVYPV